MAQHQQGESNPGEQRRGGNGSSQGNHGAEGRDFQSGSQSQRGPSGGGESSHRMGYANYREADELYRGGQDYHGGWRSDREPQYRQGQEQGQWNQGGEGAWGEGRSSYGGGQGSYGQGNYGQGQGPWNPEERGGPPREPWGQGAGRDPGRYGQPGYGPGQGSYGQGYGQNMGGQSQRWHEEYGPPTPGDPGMGGYSSFQGGEGGTRARGQQHHDPHYLQWRNEQIRKLDEDYEAWNKERYGKFSEEFDAWRRNRQAVASAKGDDAAMSSPGSTLQSSRSVAEEGEADVSGTSPQPSRAGALSGAKARSEQDKGNK